MAEEDSKVTFIYLYVNFLYHDSAVTQGDNLPLEGIPTGQKYKHEKKSINTHIHLSQPLCSLAQTLIGLGTPGKVQPDRFSIHSFDYHKAGHTQDFRQHSTASSGVPREVPDPPLYRVESVTLRDEEREFF